MSVLVGLTSIALTKWLVIALALGGLTAGLLAAWFWECTTRVRVDPLGDDPYATVLPAAVAPNELWGTAQFRAERKIARLNTLAPRWTVQLTEPAVVCGTLSSAVGLC